MKSPILGSSYVARSVNAADNRMVNLFPEIVPEGGKEPAFLQRAPGTTDTGITTTSIYNITGMHQVVTSGGLNLLYFVRSNGFVYRSVNGAAPTYIGNISGSAIYPVTMADNGEELFIAPTKAPNNSNGWVVNIQTGVLTQVAGAAFAPDNIGCGTVTYLDGYFVFNEPYTQRIYVTGLFDGLTVNPLAFATAEASPDATIAVTSINGELLVFGRSTMEWWSNVGATPFPFAPIQGAYTEVGCVAPNSISKLDNSIFWLGQDNRGQGVIYRTNGYRAERVSTHAVEWQIQRYTDLTDAIAYTYQQDGHAFYVITFPTGNATWVYDIATQAWHERGAWNGSTYDRHPSNCQAFYQGETLVGSTDGAIYKLDPDVYTLNGNDTAARWARSWRALPTGQNNLKRTAHHSLQLDAAFGDSATSVQVELSWSDNGGLTFNTPRSVNLNVSTNDFRFIWRRLGMTTQLRDRVYEVSGTNTDPVFIMGAELILSPTDA